MNAVDRIVRRVASRCKKNAKQLLDDTRLMITKCKEIRNCSRRLRIITSCSPSRLDGDSKAAARNYVTVNQIHRYVYNAHQTQSFCQDT